MVVSIEESIYVKEKAEWLKNETKKRRKSWKTDRKKKKLRNRLVWLRVPSLHSQLGH